MAVSADSRLIATGSSDRKIKIWRAETGGSLFKIKHEPAGWEDYRETPVLCLNFSRARDMLVSGSEDGTIKLWKLDGAKACACLVDACVL
jgi:WD40 repeat protein